MGRNLGSLGIALISGLISLVGAACAAGNDTPGGTGDSGMDARAADGGGVDTGPRTDTGPAPDTGPRPDTGPSVPDTGPPVDAGMTAICDRCIDHAECGPLARCIQLTGGTRVCAPTCVPDIPTCGRGFQCVRNFAVSEDLTVCVPVGERCCLDEDDDDYGIGAGCDGLDCDDAVMSTFPGAREECNGVDDDCDGNVDMPLAMGACDGGRMCVGGACTCPDGLTDCAEAGCVDTDTDVANCGTCGNECPASAEGTAACSGGECGTACGEACAPFACDGDSGLCFDTCTDSSMCATGFDCRMGMCLPGPGSMCTMDSECASGFCTDGYCCRTRCDGDCEVCNLPTREGYCDPAPAGEDPRGDCEADDISTCDRDGTCDGSRRCALYPEGRVCQPPTCMGAMSRRAGRCDGFGNCDPGMSDACPPYVCDAASGMCNVSCDDTSDCIAGYDCALGVCRRARGQPCMLDTECATGFCTDNVCCEARCDGECERCDASGRVGYCDAVPAGDDPDAECGATACGTTGTCSGDRSCARHPMGATCGPASCMSATISNQPDVCNAGEMCVDSGTRDCSPGTCDPATGLCRTTCMSTAECAANHTCVGGTCRRNDGQPCVAGTECVSNSCCGGFCRNTTNDVNNCGACGRQCTNPHGTTSCSSSTCQPVCSPISEWRSCDSDPVDGCETSIRTLTDCGACNTACSLANATESCSTGSCVVTSCSAGFANCDPLHSNGCEVQLSAYSNSCGSAIDLGDADGDVNCNSPLCGGTPYFVFNTASGRGSRWFRASAIEDSICSADLRHRITLTVPADADYDLFVYRSCGGAAVAQSRLGTGMTDQVVIEENESSGVDDDFDYWIEVRWFSGNSCSNWGLQVEGRVC